MDRRYRGADFLRRRYVDARQSASDIAADCGVTSSTIARWLDRHDIERQPRYENEVWLHEQYVELGRRQQDIADDCGVTKSTICHWLGRHGITDGPAYERTECDNCGDHFRYAPSLRDGGTARTPAPTTSASDRLRSSARAVARPSSGVRHWRRSTVRWRAGAKISE